MVCLLYANVKWVRLEGDVMLFSGAGTQMTITFVKQAFFIKVWLVNIIGNIFVHIRMKHNVQHDHKNDAMLTWN